MRAKVLIAAVILATAALTTELQVEQSKLNDLQGQLDNMLRELERP